VECSSGLLFFISVCLGFRLFLRVQNRQGFVQRSGFPKIALDFFEISHCLPKKFVKNFFPKLSIYIFPKKFLKSSKFFFQQLCPQKGCLFITYKVRMKKNYHTKSDQIWEI